MRVFAKLRSIADYQRRHLPEIRTPEDQELVREIGHHQMLGAPLTLKQAMLLGIGSSATTERRLGRLKRLGLVRGRRSASDARVVELTLSPACMKAYARLEEVFAAEDAPVVRRQRAARGAHVCAVCAGEPGGVDAMLRFLQEGVARGRSCIVLGPEPIVARAAALARNAGRRRDCGELVTSSGNADPKATMAFLAAQFVRAQAEDRRVRLAVHGGWARARHLPFEAVMRVEDEIRHLVDRYGGHVLCVLDMRAFSGPQLLELLKAHSERGVTQLEVT
jgi:hypothetical protein